jgi:hypothetical protein
MFKLYRLVLAPVENPEQVIVLATHIPQYQIVLCMMEAVYKCDFTVKDPLKCFSDGRGLHTSRRDHIVASRPRLSRPGRNFRWQQV